MAKITEVRLTLAAFIYGIEIDLKEIIKKYIIPFQGDLDYIQDSEKETIVLERFKLENPGLEYKNCLINTVDYIDFGDTFIVLKKHSVFLQKQTTDYLNDIYNDLVTIIPIRNRVMHTRPLLSGDFTTVYDFITKLKPNNPIDWKVTLDTRDSIEKDPSYVLTLKFPIQSFSANTNSVIHNLPCPDFDETGFIGRLKDIDDVKKLILTNNVVTILGDGGIGKSALAIKVVYDILDMNDNCPFELIIWTTAKTATLTAKGIESIYTTIKDYTGLINEISKTFDEEQNENKNELIYEYLSLFKTLLIIDNLETIHNEEVRDFIREAQTHCKILITSRIGLGELEYPRKLNGLSESDSAKLIREIARIRNSETLMKLPQRNLVEISEKLYFNPLALKWFVSTVETGISPTEVLNNKDNLLNFCLTNVYEKLSEGAITILNTIRASRRKLTTGEIIYLSELEPIEVRKFLIELFKTTLISREIADVNNLEEVYHFISDFAKDFLSSNYPVHQEYIVLITRRYKALEDGLKDIKKYSKYNEFSINAISFETPNQRIAAKFLSEALVLSKTKDYKGALVKVKEAKNIDSNYYEVYRVSAFIKATQGDILGAEEDYEIGLEIAPDNLRLLYYYANFLIYSIEDSSKAFVYAQKVYNQKPNHPYTSFLLARCHNHNKDYANSIQILKSLITKGNLDSKNKRVAYTELISTYGHYANSLLKFETDIENAINHYKKAINEFDYCVSNNIMDYKLLKNFVDIVFSYIITLPATEIDNNKKYLKSVLTKFEKQIYLTHLSAKLFVKYSEKFNDYDFQPNIAIQNNNETLIGNIGSFNPTLNFVFIETDNKKYYANRGDFSEIKKFVEWKSLQNGQLVSFEIGTNPQGECAKNIKLLKFN